jgi:hypothetical protein
MVLVSYRFIARRSQQDKDSMISLGAGKPFVEAASFPPTFKHSIKMGGDAKFGERFSAF